MALPRRDAWYTKCAEKDEGSRADFEFFARAHTQFNLEAVAEFRQETITIGITVANAQNGRMHNLRGSCARNYMCGGVIYSRRLHLI